MSELLFFPATDSLKLLYAGNIGYAQDWEPLISLAEKTKGASIEYFIIGEGVMKPVLEEKVRELELDNVHILSLSAQKFDAVHSCLFRHPVYFHEPRNGDAGIPFQSLYNHGMW